jgi:hypothetical protein
MTTAPTKARELAPTLEAPAVVSVGTGTGAAVEGGGRGTGVVATGVLEAGAVHDMVVFLGAWVEWTVWKVVLGVVVVHSRVTVLMPTAVVMVTAAEPEAEAVAVALAEPEALPEEAPEAAEILKGFEYWKIWGLLTSLMTRP